MVRLIALLFLMLSPAVLIESGLLKKYLIYRALTKKRDKPKAAPFTPGTDGGMR